MYSDLIFDYLKNNTESSEDLGLLSQTMEFGVSKDSYEITTDEESDRYNKPKGKYELMSVPDVLEMGDIEIDYCVNEFSKTLISLFGKISSRDRILVVGLGNRHISSDSLGSKVVGKINITIDNHRLPKVMAISPSVMGLTGIETVEIVEGVILKTKPTHVIVIDSLCAGSVERLGKSIQATNTGICPGGGIGNRRKCIDRDIAPNVFSIGIPLLIFASTFVSETLGNHGIYLDKLGSIMHNCKKERNNKDLMGLCKALNSVIKDVVDNIIVSMKDIDECVEKLSFIVASAINIALGVDG